MIKIAIRLLRYTVLALSCGICSAKEVCSEPTEYQPSLCRIALPRITAIQIVENGARMSETADPQVNCAQFKVTVIAVRRYFSKARKVDETDALHKLIWSPCYASGTLQFANGKTASWSISLAKTGSLAFDGKNGMVLYCPDCKFKPFAW